MPASKAAMLEAGATMTGASSFTGASLIKPKWAKAASMAAKSTAAWPASDFASFLMFFTTKSSSPIPDFNVTSTLGGPSPFKF